MSDIFKNFTVQEVLLLGIIIYVCVIILLLWVRYCVITKMLCPYSGIGLHCTYHSRCWCNTCKTCGAHKFASCSGFCCTRNHSVKERGCLEFLPKCNFKCFLPRCGYLYCMCCECNLENSGKIGDSQEIDLAKAPSPVKAKTSGFG